MDSSPSLASLPSVIKQGIENRLKELHTSLPGIIQSFDAATQLASVQPAIKRIFKTLEQDVEMLVPTALPLLINVPIQFPRGGGFSLTFPVQKGDECLLVFCERSIDNWYRTGKVETPLDRRFHDFSDATAFVGISSSPNAVPNYDPDNVQLKKDDGTVSVTLKELTLELTAVNTKVIGNFEVTGDTVLAANVTSNGKDISDTHTHSGSLTAPLGGVSNTGTPI